ncbi:MAG: ABC transporter ATP-binding protein, partial [Solirubrobacterales bacterium]|nr:ABC transporter ATP-binding protein [Solirubrobacterales bacterium]
MSASSDDRLAIEGLSVARGGRTVVREVSLEITGGEVTALLGPNGAGKSSMVLAIGGVLKPLGGKILLDDLNF